MASKDALIKKLLQVCENENGYLEKKTREYLYDKYKNAGYNNYTKYWEDIKPSYQTEPWCAIAVTWTLEQVVGRDIAKKMLKHFPYVYCPTMQELFTLNSNPKVGDIVIFWRGGTFAHTGWVSKVVGDYFETYEGNTSSGHSIVANGGGFCHKSYYNSNLPGTKFVTLDWSLASDIDLGEDITDDEYETLASRLYTVENIQDMVHTELRIRENHVVYNRADETMPHFARGIVKALIDAGIIKGINDAGDLALDYDDLRLIAFKYRAGAYDEILNVKRGDNGDIITSSALKFI